MIPSFKSPFLSVCLALLMSTGVGHSAGPNYTRDIRPILAKRCMNCHGPDAAKRKADLRLDTKDGLLHPDVLIPGKSAESELIKRVLTSDPEEVMPPPGKGDPVTAEERQLLQAWIDAGAAYQGHWAFAAPVKPAVPVVAGARNEIDAFVFEAQAKQGMAPTTEASKEVWLRRVSFDLTGLPPTLEEQDAFIADTSPLAYKHVVDRLLQSPAYGERLGNEWLDVARYADTYGRHEDEDCTTWPYRDWVIKAFNDNLPYDQFITWQTAGDLLPNPTKDQLVATCFNRLPQQSNEAGSDAEEFRIEQVADRVRTNGTAFMGLTLECARCHDHKYDPISTKDYYSMSSFFNNIDELGLFAVYTGAVPPPSILLFKPEQEKRYEELKTKIATLEKAQRESTTEARKLYESWLALKLPPIKREDSLWRTLKGWFVEELPTARAAHPVAHYDFESLEKKAFLNRITGKRQGMIRQNNNPEIGRFGNALELMGDNSVSLNDVPEIKRSQPFSMALWLKPREMMQRAVVISRSRSGIDSASKGFELILENNKPSFALVHFSPGNEIRISAKDALPLNEWTHVAATYDGSSRASGLALYINGKRHDAVVVRDNLYKDIVYRTEWGDQAGKDSVELRCAIGGRYNDASYRNGLVDEFYFYTCQLSAPEVAQLAALPETATLEDWFPWYLRERNKAWRATQKKLTAAREELNAMTPQATELMVMQEWSGPKRPTHILDRGQFNSPKAEVSPATLEALPALDPTLPRNRLGFAKWLTDPKNPLTARVAVNRYWQLFFGRGLVLTSEDFGTQGQQPTHPELLDWLALRFIDSGWNVKSLCRDIVLSATYRQSSEPTDKAWLKSDPDNRWLTRGPRKRLGAEQVRDLALLTSGLLVDELGGKSTKPYQPDGLWDEAGTQHVYVQDHGKSLYRRSLYTFWRRTLPPPAMTIFDAPSREFCKVRRDHTATPLQALVLMNDPQFIEAGRVLAANLVKKYPQAPESRVTDAFRLLTSQRPTPEQNATLVRYLQSERANFANDTKAAQTLLTNGESPTDKTVPADDVAATTMMIRLLFGFSETTMKP